MTDRQNRLFLRWRDGEAANTGQLEDYAVYALALTELYRLTFEPAYLQNALERARQMVELFEDKEHGGYFITAYDAEQLLSLIHISNDENAQSGNIFAILQKSGEASGGFSLNTMKEDISSGSSGLLYYNGKQGTHNVISYVPLNVKDWYLITIMRADVTPDSTGIYVNVTILVTVLITIVFLGLFLFIIWNNRRNQKELEHIAYVDPVTQGMSWAKFQAVAPVSYTHLDVYKRQERRFMILSKN